MMYRIAGERIYFLVLQIRKHFMEYKEQPGRCVSGAGGVQWYKKGALYIRDTHGIIGSLAIPPCVTHGDIKAQEDQGPC